MDALEGTEHPEIAVSLVELGMIHDVVVEDGTAQVVIALPMLNIPEAVRDAILRSIFGPVLQLGLNLRPSFVEMAPDVRTQFFEAAKANWKGSI